MSILLFRGLPGSGKSYGVVENVILPALKTGRVVYTNIPLNDKLILEDFQSVVNNFTLEEAESDNYLNEIESGALVVIDEAWRLFPSGMRADKIPHQIKSFFAEHRHKVCSVSGLTTEIVLVTQRTSQLCAFVRGLIETTYQSNKLKGLGSSKGYRVDIYEGSPQDDTNKPKVRQIFGKYKKDVYKYYTSNTQNQSGVVANEKDVDSRTIIWKSPKFLAIVFFAVVFLTYSLSNLDYFDNLSGQPKIQEVEEVNAEVKRVPVTVSKAPRFKRLNFIEQFKDVYIDSYFEDGNHKQFIFRFSIDKDSYVDFDQHALLNIGYELVVMNPCLVKVKSHSLERFITCKETHDVEEKNEGFF